MDTQAEDRKRIAFERERNRMRREFGANLGKVRKGKRLTQEALSEEAKLHRTEIGYLEQGRREPRLHTMLILADTLKVPLHQLAEGVAVPKHRKPPSHSKRR
jgi:transcriptional regulator with XRE-family HTH domain